MDKRHGLEYLGLLGVLFADWELLGNGLGAFTHLLLVNLHGVLCLVSENEIRERGCWK